MSDVLIKNMEMPETCNKCFIDHRKCEAHQRQIKRIANSETEQIFDLFGEMRLDGCPLSEVKPHGRLIDADEFSCALSQQLELISKLSNKDDSLVYDTVRIIKKMLEDAPTVLEANNG